MAVEMNSMPKLFINLVTFQVIASSSPSPQRRRRRRFPSIFISPSNRGPGSTVNFSSTSSAVTKSERCQEATQLEIAPIRRNFSSSFVDKNNDLNAEKRGPVECHRHSSTGARAARISRPATSPADAPHRAAK